MSQQFGDHALVIGGSIAGLLSARVLSEHFAQVTILERDQLEERAVLHKSVPQGNHVHALLYGGERAIESLLPGFSEDLERLGALSWTAGRDVLFLGPTGVAYNGTGSVREPRDLGFAGHVMSRGLLEYALRRRALAARNIALRQRTSVRGLLHRNGMVCGVISESEDGEHSVEADLIVDASGRGSRAVRWLGEMGFDAPTETTIGVDFAYTSVKLKKPSGSANNAPIVLVGGPPPKQTRGAGLFEIEGGIWHLSLAGRFGDYPPTDREGFMAFARDLPSLKLYEWIKEAELVSDITHHRFPTSVQRHFEWMPSFPERFLVLGDAVCSFNPVYGQGMSSAALQVKALQEVLSRRAADSRRPEGLAREFFPKAADVISAPWILAANFDFAYPQTTGERPPAMEEGARYFAALDEIQAEDIEIQRIVLEVFQLVKPLAALWSDPLRERVLARLQRSSG
jgi:2-polyprenyl-6-methoxyphenol hydroxylase-like FAD-dependent oxidoreductase